MSGYAVDPSVDGANEPNKIIGDAEKFETMKG